METNSDWIEYDGVFLSKKAFTRASKLWNKMENERTTADTPRDGLAVSLKSVLGIPRTESSADTPRDGLAVSQADRQAKPAPPE